MTINHIFDTSIYPDELKIAKVIPIYKSGRKDLVENYRPISILPTISKIIESFIYQQLMDFVTLTNYIHPDQFGFVPKSGTEIATVNLIHDICVNLDKLLLVSAIFIDLKKAFDMVNRNILINKIALMNVDNKVYWRFYQFVSMNNINSERKPSKSGITCIYYIY